MKIQRHLIARLTAFLFVLFVMISPPLPAGAHKSKGEGSPTTRLQVSPKSVKSKADARSKVGRHLQKLYNDFKSFKKNRSFGKKRKFRQQNSMFQVSGDYVVIDAIALGDPNELKKELEGLGIKSAGVFGKMVSGLLPISAVDQLPKCNYLNFARPSMVSTRAGSVTSQGDPAMRADVARSTFAVDGSGVTIGVLSDSYDCLGGAAADITSGDLPASGVTVLDDSACPATDEGRAMLQIVHDVAPGATLSFHTAFTGQANFAQGIVDLANAGAKVIVDDVIYLAEPMFQDGIIAQAVDQVEAAGVAFFSAAGNNSRKSYEDNFRGGQTIGIGPNNFEAHDFDPGPGVDIFQKVSIPSGGSIVLSLQWDSPALSAGGPGSPNDVNVYITDEPPTTVLASSTDPNIGLDPVELFSFQNTGGTQEFNLVITNGGGANPGKIKYVRFGNSTITEFDTESSTSYGHPNALGAEGTGAAHFIDTPEFGISPPQLESFSSIGGVPILFDTAGNRLASPEIRFKPNVVGPDGVLTTFFGSPNFFGTSAAAPHVAGVAALMIENNPALLPAEIYSAMESTALDMDDPGTSGFDTGVDFASGYGLVQADAAIASVSGPAPVQVLVPDVVGLPQSQAEAAIVVATLAVGAITSQSSATVPAGEVISQNPSAASLVSSGSAVDIVVSTGSPSASTALDIRVSTGSDDAEESPGGAMNLTSSDLELVQEGSLQTVGMRFNGVNIPPGTTITKAYVQFQVDEANTEATNLIIQGEKSLSAPTFTSSNGNITSRPLTTASVAWSPSEWPTVGVAGPDQQTSDIKSIIQEIVNQGGWTSGNSLVIIITGTGKRVADSFNGDANGAALLHVEFSSGPSSSPPQVAVPNVVGLTQTAAEAEIIGVGLVPNVTTASSETVPAGNVISQNPSATTPVNVGSVVDIGVSTGSPSASTTLEIRVSASSDDAEESSGGGVKLSSSDLELVQESSLQTVGMRFTGVSIPQGATITKAYIQFQVDEVNDEATALTVHGEKSPNPLTFTGSNGNISSRTPTLANVPWSPAGWPIVGAAGPDQQTPDIKSVVQEIVSQGGWVSGNSLVIVITGTGKRVAESFNGDPNGAPLLHVEFSTGPPPPPPAQVAVPDVVGLPQTQAETAIVAANLVVGAITPQSSETVPAGEVISQTPPAATAVDPGSAVNIIVSTGPPSILETLDIRVSASSDDAEEPPGGGVNLTSSDLELVNTGGNQTVGMRFNGVAIPQGATISRAYLQFQVDEATTEPTALTIHGEKSLNAVTFTSANGNISSRSLTAASVPWSPATWPTVGAAGPDQQTSDIKSIIQEIVSQGGWASGNSLSIIITGTGKRVAESFNGDPNGAALLHVEFSTGPPPPPAAVPDVVGLPQANAETNIVLAGLIVGAVTTVTSDTVPDGNVISQNPAGGTQAPENSPVNLVVSIGPPSASTTLDVRVSATSDDAEESSGGSVGLGSSDLELVQEGSLQTVGMRFNGVTIPQGSTITNAYVQFQVDEATTGAANLIIKGEKSLNAVTFSSSNGNITSRNPTVASVPWNPAGWPTVGAAGPDQRTSDIKSVIQEIANQGGWTSGNSLVILITGTGKRVAESFNGDPNGAALLHVEFSATSVLGKSAPTGFKATRTSFSNFNPAWNATTENPSGSKYGKLFCRGWDCVADGMAAFSTPASLYDANLSANSSNAYSVVQVKSSGKNSKAGSSKKAKRVRRQEKIFTLVGAGDIANHGRKGGPKATAKLLDRVIARHPDAIVFTAGDNAYSKGTPNEYKKHYHPTWGKHRSRTFPSPGNHDHRTPGASGYLDYFCPSADDCVFPEKKKQLYYSYDLGNWHIISLDSDEDYKAGSKQVKWLQEDLATHQGSCILAYFHHPFYSSGKHRSSRKPKAFWKELYKAGADIVIAGHDHNYERFAKQDNKSNLDPNGIRSFVVGTGGRSLRIFKDPIANSEVRYNGSYGVIKLTLKENEYDWEFIPEEGFTFKDSGSDKCNSDENPPSSKKAANGETNQPKPKG